MVDSVISFWTFSCSLDHCKSILLENLGTLVHAPSVQFLDIPPESELSNTSGVEEYTGVVDDAHRENDRMAAVREEDRSTNSQGGLKADHPAEIQLE